jgi:hypothetical protein
MERSIPSGEFLIARSHDGGTVFRKLRDALGEESEELLDGRGILEFDGVLGAAEEFLETAKEEDFDADGL